MPMPTPARASDAMTATSLDEAPNVAMAISARTTATDPPDAALRAPMRSTTRAASGPAIANASGRAMLSSPVFVSLKPITFWSSSGVRMNDPM